MLDLFNELAFVWDTLSKKDHVIHLLVSLPDSYNVPVTALEANEKVPILEVVVERITKKKKLKEKSSGIGRYVITVIRQDTIRGTDTYVHSRRRTLSLINHHLYRV